MPQRTHIHPKKNGVRTAAASNRQERATERPRDELFSEDELPTEPTIGRLDHDFDLEANERYTSDDASGPNEEDEDEGDEDFEEDPFEDEEPSAPREPRAGALATSAWDNRPRPLEQDEPDTQRHSVEALREADWEAPTEPDLEPFDKPNERR